MTKPEAEQKYYALKTLDESDSQQGGKWKSAAQEHIISKATLTGGSDNETVKCNMSVKVDVAGDMATNVQSGDIYLSLKGFGLAAGNEQIDLYTITQKELKTETYTSEEAGVTLTNALATNELKADLYLVNKTTTQNDLAGKTLTVTLTPSAECELKPSGD